MSDARLDLLARQVDDLAARVEALEKTQPASDAVRCIADVATADGFSRCERRSGHSGLCGVFSRRS